MILFPYINKRRTNRFNYTENFGNGYWPKVNVTVGADLAVAPDGTLTADVFRKNGVSSAFSRRISPTIALPNNQIVVISVFAKAKEFNELVIQMAAKDGTFGNSGRFNLNTGQVTSRGVNNLDAQITSIGNSWHRCMIKIDSKSGVSTPRVDFILSNNGTTVWEDTGTEGIYVWGAQLEYDNYSQYIPVLTTSIVT